MAHLTSFEKAMVAIFAYQALVGTCGAYDLADFGDYPEAFVAVLCILAACLQGTIIVTREHGNAKKRQKWP